jgi:hypothetical protein
MVIENIVGARSRDRSGTPQWRGIFARWHEEYSEEPGSDVSAEAALSIFMFVLGFNRSAKKRIRYFSPYIWADLVKTF